MAHIPVPVPITLVIALLLLCFLGLHSEERMKIGNRETGVTLTKLLKIINIKKGEA